MTQEELVVTLEKRNYSCSIFRPAIYIVNVNTSAIINMTIDKTQGLVLCEIIKSTLKRLPDM